MADTVETLDIRIIHHSSGAASALKRVTSAVKDMGKAAKSTQTPLSNFLSSLKRIAFYRFIRGIIKSITQAFQEGLQKAYLFSSGIAGEGHRFAEALDRMKSAGNQMKGQLGAAFAGLLAAIEPILNAIISLIVKVADAISQLFAAFTGKTYLKANATAAKFADNMKAGAGAAKEWKNQLMGFDEINRLNEPSGGGGGGGSNPLDGYGFEDAPINPKILELVQKFKDIIGSINLEPLKASLGHLKDSLQKLAEVIIGALKWAWDNVLYPIIKWSAEEFIPIAIETLANAFDTLRLILEKLLPVFQWLWDNILKPLQEWTGEAIIAAFKEINGLLEKFNKLLEGKTTVHEFFEELTLVQEILAFIASPLWYVIGKIKELNEATEKGKSVMQFFGEKLESLGKKLQEFRDKVTEVKNRMKETFGDGQLQLSDFAYYFIARFEAMIAVVQKIVGWLQALHSWIQDAIDGFMNLSIVKAGNANASAAWDNGSVWLTGFASGGFPDEGQLFIAREAGAEMVGSIGGRTAVANNQDIVEGIRQGVYDAVMAANANGNNDVSVKVYLDSKQIKVGQQNLARAMG